MDSPRPIFPLASPLFLPISHPVSGIFPFGPFPALLESFAVPRLIIGNPKHSFLGGPFFPVKEKEFISVCGYCHKIETPSFFPPPGFSYCYCPPCCLMPPPQVSSREPVFDLSILQFFFRCPPNNPASPSYSPSIGLAIGKGGLRVFPNNQTVCNPPIHPFFLGPGTNFTPLFFWRGLYSSIPS